MYQTKIIEINGCNITISNQIKELQKEETKLPICLKVQKFTDRNIFQQIKNLTITKNIVDISISYSPDNMSESLNFQMDFCLNQLNEEGKSIYSSEITSINSDYRINCNRVVGKTQKHNDQTLPIAIPKPYEFYEIMREVINNRYTKNGNMSYLINILPSWFLPIFINYNEEITRCDEKILQSKIALASCGENLEEIVNPKKGSFSSLQSSSKQQRDDSTLSPRYVTPSLIFSVAGSAAMGAIACSTDGYVRVAASVGSVATGIIAGKSLYKTVRLK